MAINREILTKVILQVENRLSPELAKAKADAEAAAASVQKLAKGQMGNDGAAANGASLKPVPTPADNKLAEQIARAEAETKKLIATQGMSRQELQLWELKQSGASEKAIANLKRLQAEEAKGAQALKSKQAEAEGGAFGKQARETQERLAKIQRIAGLGAAALAASGAGGAVGGVLSGTLGGAAAGAALGPYGAAIGGAIGGVTSIFNAIESGAEKARAAVEKFKQEATSAASATFGAEADVRRLRRGDPVTESMLTTAAPEVARTIAMLRPEERESRVGEIYRREAEAARERVRWLETLPVRATAEPDASWFRRTFSPSTIPVTRTAAELPEAVRAFEVLRRAAEGGVRTDEGGVSFGGVESIRESLMAGVSGATSPAERTAAAAEGTREILGEILRIAGPSPGGILERMMRGAGPGPV